MVSKTSKYLGKVFWVTSGLEITMPSAEGIVISNPEVTQKTFPRYFEVFDTIATPV